MFHIYHGIICKQVYVSPLNHTPISMIYRIKSKAPNTDPCGTPRSFWYCCRFSLVYSRFLSSIIQVTFEPFCCYPSNAILFHFFNQFSAYYRLECSFEIKENCNYIVVPLNTIFPFFQYRID
jgi:hypothetical protein